MIKNITDIKDNDFKITRSADEERNLSFRNDVCSGCGICESTCPVGAIELDAVALDSRKRFDVYFSGHDKIAQNIHKDVNLERVNINEDKCVLCGMCSGLCPVDALVLTIDGVPISEIDAYPHYESYSEIDDDECIYCKKCENACPRGAITIDRVLPQRKDLVTGEISVDDDECIYCGVCSELCPAEAISVNSENGNESIEINTDNCVYCLVCKKACPVNAITAVCRSCSYGEYDLDERKAVVKGSSIIDDDLCIYCGWCEGVCPTNAASVAKPFEGTIEISQEDCQSCGTCVDVCPCDALAFLVTSAPGQKLDPMSVKDQYCIRCGACAKSCPNGAITVTRTAVNNTPTKSATWIEALDALKN